MEIKPAVRIAHLVGTLFLAPKDCALKVVGLIPLVRVGMESNQSMFYLTSMSLYLSPHPLLFLSF